MHKKWAWHRDTTCYIWQQHHYIQTPFTIILRYIQWKAVVHPKQCYTIYRTNVGNYTISTHSCFRTFIIQINSTFNLTILHLNYNGIDTNSFLNFIKITDLTQSSQNHHLQLSLFKHSIIYFNTVLHHIIGSRYLHVKCIINSNVNNYSIL